MWYGFISLVQFCFKGRVIQGTQTIDLFPMAGGRFHINSVLRRSKRVGSEGDASSFSVGFPSFAVYNNGDKGEASEVFYP